MGKANDNKKSWITAGYALFGDIGPEALNAEKLSNIVGLSRSSFYYYFKTMSGFEEELLALHLENYQRFGELMQDFEEFEQLFSNEIMVHKSALSFQRQLLINRSVERYLECSQSCRQFTESKTFELWTKLKNIDPDSKEEWELFKSLRDFYFVHYGQSDKDPQDILVLLHRYLSSDG